MEHAVPPPAPAPSSPRSAPRDRRPSECPGGACRRSLSVSPRAAPAAESTSPTTSDSRSCRGSPSDPARTPPTTRRPPRCPTVRLHPLVRLPHELLRNLVRLCLRHRLLPSLVDRCLRPDRRAPSLHPHYQASSLLRARPPLRLASVLGSSWVHHLEVSLRIEATGSHVPHTSLRWAHAVFMPVTTRAVSRHRPSSVPGQQLEPGFDDVPTLSTRRQRFTRVRLPSAHLTGYSRLFLNAHHPGRWTRRSFRWFGPWPCSPSPRGQPSSLVQHRTSFSAFSAAGTLVQRSCRRAARSPRDRSKTR